MPSAPPNMAERSDNTVAEVARQRKRGALLETAIVDATVAELASGGYGSLTIESVAARAQTGKASIYRRWPSKQDLVVHAIGCQVNGPMFQALSDELPDSVNTRDALIALIDQVAKIMAGPGGAAMRSIMGESLRDPDFAATFDCNFFDPRKQAVIRLLERGVARGEVRPDVVSILVPELLAGTMIHRVILRRQAFSRAEIEEFVDQLLMPALELR